MNAEKTLISVVIPVKNGALTIRPCLDALFAQSVAGNMELIVLDSGSTDGTTEIVRQYPVQLIPIDPASFNHGLTRNEGAKLTKGSLIYYTVQDAVLADTRALEKMAEHFADPAVAGVCGNQGVPHDPDKNPVVWYKPISNPTVERIHFPDAGEFERLSPHEKRYACAWDNVNAMYRHEILDRIPFRETDFAEDYAWARQALEAGQTIIRDSGIVTWHYHHQDFDYTFKVNFTVHYHFYKLFRLWPVYPAFFPTMAITAGRLLKEPSIGIFQKGYWFFHNLSSFAGKWYSVFVFRKWLKTGNELKLQAAYERYCGKVPQGRLKQQPAKTN